MPKENDTTVMTLSDKFVAELSSKIPDKHKLVFEISETLDMDKPSVYRRLRGAVRFTIEEIGILAVKFNISIDNLMHSKEHEGYHVHRMNWDVYFDENEDFNFDLLERQIPFISSLAAQPDSEHGAALVSLPKAVYYGYPLISKFFAFRWGHYYSKDGRFKYFGDFNLADRMLRYNEAFVAETRKIKSTYYIWNDSIFENLVGDIQYYGSIGIMTPIEIDGVKAEFHKLVDDLEEMAVSGCYPDTGNKFELYSTELSIDSSQMYFWSEKLRFGAFPVFVIGAVSSVERSTVEMMRKWILSFKPAAVLISGSAERERVIFFRRQRETIDML